MLGFQIVQFTNGMSIGVLDMSNLSFSLFYNVFLQEYSNSIFSGYT